MHFHHISLILLIFVTFQSNMSVTFTEVTFKFQYTVIFFCQTLFNLIQLLNSTNVVFTNFVKILFVQKIDFCKISCFSWKTSWFLSKYSDLAQVCFFFYFTNVRMWLLMYHGNFSINYINYWGRFIAIYKYEIVCQVCELFEISCDFSHKIKTKTKGKRYLL